MTKINSGRLPVGGELPDENLAGSSDRVLCISDVATLLTCSVEEAKRFLSLSKVPCLRLVSGPRFMLSYVLQAIRGQSTSYEEDNGRSNRIAESWSQWLTSRKQDSLRISAEEWNRWVLLMTERQISADDFRKLEIQQRKELIRRVYGDKEPPLWDVEKESLPSRPEVTTTAVRGRYLERRAFE